MVALKWHADGRFDEELLKRGVPARVIGMLAARAALAREAATEPSRAEPRLPSNGSESDDE